MRDRAFEGFGIGRCCTLILHRTQTFMAKGLLVKERIGDNLLNRRRSQAMRAERTQTPEV